MDADVTRQITLETTADDAWQALTERDGLAAWLGEALELELWAGGDLRIRLADGEERSGWVEEVEPERRLSFWWSRDDEDATRVELEIEAGDDPGETVVTVTESRPLELLELQAAELEGRGGGAPSGPLMLAGV